MPTLQALVSHLDNLLDSERMPDYGPNGLQVEGRREVANLVTGVTASQNLIDAAVKADADALLVHHGLFWEGAWPHRVTGWMAKRMKALIKHDISLIAYHLPLDKHPELGNNARILHGLGLRKEGRFGADDLGFMGSYEEGPVALDIFKARARELFGTADTNAGRGPMLVRGGEDAPEKVRKVGVVSGAGHGWLEAAADAGCDLFISGEANEATTHLARELGIHFLWAGHHATERLGVQAVGGHLRDTLGLDVRFVDDPNPV